MQASGVVQDQIVANLVERTHDKVNARRSDALFELGVCHLSSFISPHRASTEQGLEFIYRAAVSGHVGAKGYFRRLVTAKGNFIEFSQRICQDKVDTNQWLVDAAEQGHTVALEELLELKGDPKVNLSRMKGEMSLPSKMFEKEYIKGDGYGTTPLEANNLREILRLADIETLHTFFRTHPEVGAYTDQTGNSALMIAAEARCFAAVIALLELGAIVNHRNRHGETILHHLWQFSDNDAVEILDRCYAAGIDVDATSSNPLAFHDLDPLPLLPGRAVERTAGRGRAKILAALLSVSPPLRGLDEDYIRRMLLWAVRLGFVEVFKTVLEICRDSDSSAAEGEGVRQDLFSLKLQTISSIVEGEKHGLMTTVAQGWLSGAPAGWTRPEHFWRLCCHGENAETRLRETIECIWRTSSQPLCNFDLSLKWALNHGRTGFVKTFLQILILEHGPILPVGIERESSIHHCARYFNPNEQASGFDNPPTTRQVILKKWLLVSNP